MGKCLNCDKELEQVAGKKERKFCDSSCRSSYWQKMNKADKVEVRKNEAVGFSKYFSAAQQVRIVEILNTGKSVVLSLVKGIGVIEQGERVYASVNEAKPEIAPEVKTDIPSGEIKPRVTLDDLRKIEQSVMNNKPLLQEEKPQKKPMAQWIKEIDDLQFEGEYMTMSQRIEQDEDLTRREKDQLLTHMRSGKI